MRVICSVFDQLKTEINEDTESLPIVEVWCLPEPEITKSKTRENKLKINIVAHPTRVSIEIEMYPSFLDM